MTEPARGANGKFRRDLAHVERDAEACRLASMGWSYQRISDHLGMAGKAHAWQAVQRTLVETARREGAETLRQQMLAEAAELRRQMWEHIEDPQPLVDRVGRIVRDENGVPVVDVQAKAAAATIILRTMDRVAKLKGLDAIKKTASLNLNHADINAIIRLAQDEIARTERERADDIRSADTIAAAVEPPDIG